MVLPFVFLLLLLLAVHLSLDLLCLVAQRSTHDDPALGYLHTIPPFLTPLLERLYSAGRLVVAAVQVGLAPLLLERHFYFVPDHLLLPV